MEESILVIMACSATAHFSQPTHQKIKCLMFMLKCNSANFIVYYKKCSMLTVNVQLSIKITNNNSKRLNVLSSTGFVIKRSHAFHICYSATYYRIGDANNNWCSNFYQYDQWSFEQDKCRMLEFRWFQSRFSAQAAAPTIATIMPNQY